MGKLNKLISDLATHMGRWTATRAGHIDTIKNNTDAIKKQLTDGTMKAGAVKSVQRGVASMTGHAKNSNGFSPLTTDTDYYEDLIVNLSTVNPAKCIVLLDGQAFYNSSVSGHPISEPYLVSLASNKMVIRPSAELDSVRGKSTANGDGTYTVTSSCKISWQVIEFY